ncbi:hypothetical protein DSO57_1008253 [Entomophthora muscae]|uniref:Uncharacterized protein n=1 Tax=Entomophthora muscae TaxID=34485 RepID=A0ACC2TIC5_9FUNG|nr:hypothetical protein DSO57_1008253 [Entomophthora muscae]
MIFGQVLFPLFAVLGDRFTDRELDGIPYRQLDDAVQKSRVDYREYLGLQLNNQMRVLIISDPRASEDEVSLTVGSGANDDPKNLPGLAHLCQRLIMRGSDKYPSSSDFQDFLETNGGRHSGMTSRDYTQLSFTVDNQGLDDGLDKFSSFFINPTFLESQVVPEINAINYIYRSNNSWPFTPFNQATLAALNSPHPATRFPIGSYETLFSDPTKQGIDIHEAVKAHYNKHYSSNLMSLVVRGRDGIEALKKMVIPKFSSIPNKQLMPTNAGSPYSSSNLATNVLVHVQKDIEEINVQFTLEPMDFPKYQKTLGFFEHLLRTNGNTSLSEVFVANGLFIRWSGQLSENQRGFSLFNFNFRTKATEENKSKILYILFAYLNAIKTQGIAQEKYQRYYATLNNVQPIPLVTELGAHLQQGASLQTVLGYFGEVPAFDQQLLNHAFRQFNASNFILYETRSFDGPSETEPWFGLKYASSKINTSLIAKLASVTAKDFGIKLPTSPLYEPFPIPSEKHQELQIKLLANDSIGYILLAKDATIVDPSVKLEFKFNSSLKQLACIDLLREMMQTLIPRNNKVSSSLFFVHSITGNSIAIELRDKQEAISKNIATFATSLKMFNITADTLDSAKKAFLQSMGSRDPQPSEPIPLLTLGYLMDPYARTYQQKLKEASKVTLECFKQFFEGFFINLHFNIVGSGVVASETLYGIKDTLMATFESNSPAGSALIKPRFSHRGNAVYVEKNLLSYSEIRFHLSMYEAKDVDKYALAYATSALIGSRFHHQLTNIETLGFHSDFRLDDKEHGLSGYIQSDQSPVYLESRIEAFIDAFVAEMKQLPESKLNATMASLAKLLNKPVVIHPSPAQDWNFVQTYLPLAQRNQATIKYLKTLTKATLIDFLETYLLKSSTQRSKLSIHANPTHPTKPSNYTLADCGDLIADYASWHLSAFEYASTA